MAALKMDAKTMQFSIKNNYNNLCDKHKSQMKYLSLVLFLSTALLYASEDICTVQWIQKDGKKYHPPKSLETLTIRFENQLDRIEFKTKNNTSYYDYKSFLNVRGQLGISYKANNGNLMDLFQNGTLMIWKGNTPILKAKCPTLKLDISTRGSNHE